jgi:hypothetical protein
MILSRQPSLLNELLNISLLRLFDRLKPIEFTDLSGFLYRDVLDNVSRHVLHKVRQIHDAYLPEGPGKKDYPLTAMAP